ncbi:NAD(P)-dependent alcohol dehydrogenase [Pseudenhygromyxa sp. WMMC2535]|uniref:NAD(P)-dependent alcohol dehydrogenase n=1 Tax=Pseudenhygromyxa sp. WMMC2535 TaxID=2712867 RepID=UPI001555F303|nr:NAD(P)-dependent alcohol dehydrogenase [Pseudenhygromyxa sp. WMMC2535]NVB42590.1 NAD(P)-dependent alcohol dehydrogenase [Pseudenhygromyxa sp. WMMC2535]
MSRLSVRAAVARRGEPFVIETCELDDPGPNEVRVAVEACGLCHTDLTAQSGGFGTPLPAVLGHEGVGRVEALGEGVDHLAIGDRVIMSFGACGSCPSCADSRPAYCRHALDFNVFGRRLDGSSPLRFDGVPLTGHFFGQSSFATHAVAAATNLVEVDDDLPATVLAPLACGVQTGVGAVVNVLRPAAGDRIAVFGCGTVGLSAIMAAKLAGCAEILAFDLHASRLELAHSLGATTLVDCTREQPSAVLRGHPSLDLAFDNTGNPKVIMAGFAAVRAGGTMALAGVAKHGAELRLDPNRIMNGRSLRGTIEGDADPKQLIPEMIAWIRDGALAVERLVTPYPFAAIDDAAEDMRAGRTIKPVLLMEQELPT